MTASQGAGVRTHGMTTTPNVGRSIAGGPGGDVFKVRLNAAPVQAKYDGSSYEGSGDRAWPP
jgi:hypothetical protein